MLKDYEIKAASHQVEQTEKAVKRMALTISKRLREAADDIEALADRRDLKELTEEVLHIVLWMVPNLPLEQMQRQTTEWMMWKTITRVASEEDK